MEYQKWKKWAKAWLVAKAAHGLPPESLGPMLFVLLGGRAADALDGVEVEQLQQPGAETLVFEHLDRIFAVAVAPTVTPAEGPVNADAIVAAGVGDVAPGLGVEARGWGRGGGGGMRVVCWFFSPRRHTATVAASTSFFRPHRCPERVVAAGPRLQLLQGEGRSKLKTSPPPP